MSTIQTEQTNVPKLRFPGFEADWERKSLGEVSTCLDRIRVPLKEGDRSIRRGEFPYYGASGIIDYIDDYLFDEPLVLLAEDGANILMRSSPVAFIARGKYWVNNHAHVYRANESTEFLAEVLERLDYTKYNTGTAQPKLNGEMCKSLPLHIPTELEQQKIAASLGAVDTKIEQISRKKALFEDYKRGVMQQIFSQEIRFKDDQGNDFPDWEEKRLDSVADIVGGGTPDSTKPIYWSGTISWFTPTEIKTKYLGTSQRKITDEGLRTSSAKLLPIGALLLSTRATVGDIGIALNECCTNQGFQSLIVKASNVNEFWYYWIKQNKRQLLRRASGSTFLEIGKSEISKISVLAPGFDEQKKIADFLTSIDTKINLVNQQLDAAKTFKRGLLQQMFV